ncbi:MULTISPECIES: DUF5131 family protein [unclassified Nocardioides]|uniref:DUF5131 family protein n=1 Tax=unclassified Nocardioides TaxID=2615069 RepID=UPI001F610AD0|nr:MULTISPECIES: DUF5131 family protein [unclassified Nocardioides]
MSDKSAIEWTEATWNPTTGCDRVSAGCDNCYALTSVVVRRSRLRSCSAMSAGFGRRRTFTRQAGFSSSMSSSTA